MHLGINICILKWLQQQLIKKKEWGYELKREQENMCGSISGNGETMYLYYNLKK